MLFSSLSLYSVSYINRTCSNLSDLVDKCSEGVSDHNDQSLGELTEHWKKSKRIFSLLIHESDIKEIDLELENIKICLADKDASGVKKSVHLFKEKLVQICENEKISIGNIL